MRTFLSLLLLAVAACGGADTPATTSPTPAAQATEPAPAEPAPAADDLPPEVVADVEAMLELFERVATAAEAGGCDGIAARVEAAVSPDDVARMKALEAKDVEYETYRERIMARYDERFQAATARLMGAGAGCEGELMEALARLGLVSKREEGSAPAP